MRDQGGQVETGACPGSPRGLLSGFFRCVELLIRLLNLRFDFLERLQGLPGSL